jgi:hypothetical protein
VTWLPPFSLSEGIIAFKSLHATYSGEIFSNMDHRCVGHGHFLLPEKPGKTTLSRLLWFVKDIIAIPMAGMSLFKELRARQAKKLAPAALPQTPPARRRGENNSRLA